MPLIAVLVYSIMEVFKAFVPRGKEKWHSLIPILSSFCGGLLGLGWYFLSPELALLPNVGTAVVMGVISGLGATGGNQVFKQFQKKASKDEEKEVG